MQDEAGIVRRSMAGALLLLLVTVATADANRAALEALGQALFFDTNLSAERNQSCGSCHDPGRAFSDARDSGVGGAVSLGDDGKSLGDRNTPSTMYAFLVPDFHQDQQGEYLGGFFLDGRATTLVDQVAEPFVNPLEMALPDHAAVVTRVRENPVYVEQLQSLFGDKIFSDPARAFRAIAESIAAFERTPQFAPFDSKYDRFLRGEYRLTAEEELGRLLIFSQLVNCGECHLLETREFSQRELFTNHRYHNIGVPVNRQARAANGVAENHRDLGLAQNASVHDSRAAGKFRVPSLRNVAVTGPYMHNGVFHDLETAVRFYNRFLLSNEASQVNPETGEPWGEPEVSETVDFELLRSGQPLAENQIDAIVAFLEALTDRRYEHLLDQAADAGSD
ncbi:MAG: cytochrome c peroxidase [Woeseiaceae bacterium]|nr:cytochrome c peroxidase [Woeseiaceae bacterium]